MNAKNTHENQIRSYKIKICRSLILTTSAIIVLSGSIACFYEKYYAAFAILFVCGFKGLTIGLFCCISQLYDLNEVKTKMEKIKEPVANQGLSQSVA